MPMVIVKLAKLTLSYYFQECLLQLLSGFQSKSWQSVLECSFQRWEYVNGDIFLKLFFTLSFL